jgi:hypothetical protein
VCVPQIVPDHYSLQMLCMRPHSPALNWPKPHAVPTTKSNFAPHLLCVQTLPMLC